MGETRGYKRPIIIGLAFLVMLGIHLLPLPAGLPRAGWQVLGIFLGVLILWLFEAIDWPSILALVALATVPGVKVKELFGASFGNVTFAFLLATFLCTYAVSQTSFIKRVAVGFVGHPLARRSPWAFSLLFFASILILGCIISPTVLFIVYLPILEGIYEIVGLKKGEKAAGMLMMGLVFLCGISSGMTPIAHVFPLIAMEIYQEMSGQVISYGSYMAMAIPVGLLASAAMLAIFRWLLRPDMSRFKNLDVRKLKEDLPGINRRERLTVGIFFLVILLWVLPSLVGGITPGFAKAVDSYGIAMPPMLGVVLLSIFTYRGKPLLDFKTAMAKGVPWGSLMICSAALAIGAIMTKEEVGLKGYLAGLVGPLAANLTPWLVILLFLLWSALQTNFSSNIVTATLVTTVAVPILLQLPGIHAGAVAALIGLLSAYAFATPPAMPSVAIAGGTGWTSPKDLFGYGLLVMAASVLICLFVGYPLAQIFF